MGRPIGSGARGRMEVVRRGPSGGSVADEADDHGSPPMSDAGLGPAQRLGPRGTAGA